MSTSNTKSPSGQNHAKAAEAHESAAKSMRMAGEAHQKGDHKAGLDHAEAGMTSSHGAHEATKTAHADSKNTKH